MSAIGNYIHYHKNNYQQWGINQKNTTASEPWETAASNFKKQLMEINNTKKLMQDSMNLEKKYNKLFYSTGTPEKDVQTFKQAMEESIQNRLKEEFGLAAATFNSENLSISENELQKQMTSKIKNLKEKMKQADLKKVRTVQDLLRQVNLLEDILKQGEFKSIPEATARVIVAEEQLKIIKETLKNQIKESNGSRVPINWESKDIQTLKAIIQEFDREAALSNQSGQVFEWLLPFIQFQGIQIGKEELKKEMESLMKNSGVVQGAGKTTIDIPDLRNSKLTDVDIITDNIKMTTMSTTNKTDVKITYEGKKKSVQTKNISAKNSKEIKAKLVDSTSLYNVLLLSDAYNFATHYLNVVTAAPGERSSAEKIVQANRLVQGLILRSGAEGYDKANKPEVLVINNYTEKHIYVFNIKVLINSIQNLIINQNVKYDNIFKGFNDNFTIDQHFDQESKDRRIVKIVQSTMKNKITATLRGDAFSPYLKMLRKF